MRKELTFAATITKSGSGAHIFISKKDMEKLGLTIGSDVDVTIRIPDQRE